MQKESFIHVQYGYVAKEFIGRLLNRREWVACLFCDREEFDKFPGKEKAEEMKGRNETWYEKQVTPTIRLVCTQPPVTSSGIETN